MTSNGATLGVPLKCISLVTLTLSGGSDFTCSAPATLGVSSMNIVASSTERLVMNGGMSLAGNLSCTATLVIGGGNFVGSAATYFEPANLVFQGTVNITNGWRMGGTSPQTITCTSGNITMSGTVSLAGPGAGFSMTFNTPAMKWSALTWNNSSYQMTINGTLNVGTLTLGSTPTISGTAGFNADILIITGAGASITLKNGVTYTVNTSFTAIGTAASKITIKSDSSGLLAMLNIGPNVTTIYPLYCSATDIDSSGGQTINQYGGTISASSRNWNTLTTLQYPQYTTAYAY
jgi:hypothetical protein